MRDEPARDPRPHTEEPAEQVQPPEDAITDLSPPEAEQSEVAGGQGGKGPPNTESFLPTG